MHRGGAVVLVIIVALSMVGCRADSTAQPGASTSPAAVAPPGPDATTEPALPEATSRAIPVPAATRTATGMVAELAPTKTAAFSLVGVTWDRMAGAEQVMVQVRVRTDEGWSGWERLEVDHDGDEAGRGGTEPWWVEGAHEVRARVVTPSGDSLTGINVVVVDPGADPATVGTTTSAFFSESQSSSVFAAADGRPAFTGQPRVIARTSWGARASKGCGTDGYKVYGASTQGIVLHHSAGSNSYSKKASASIVRGIQKFHMAGRGWCDIAYNFLVDKYGQIFEGRAGGIHRSVRGSHSGNNAVNELTMGVALMGNLDKKKPSTAMKNATVKLIGWRVGTTYLPAKGVVKLGPRWLNRISGHRNVVSTACPGKYGYRWLNAKGGLRDRVAAYVSGYRSAIKTAAASIPASVKGPVVVGEFGAPNYGVTSFANLDFYWFRQGPGAFYVAGAVRSAFNAVGGRLGVLGYPTSNMGPASPGLGLQTFQGGAIYRVEAAAPTLYVIHGPIHAAYAASGGHTGPLGWPLTGIVVDGTTKRATFEHGTITQSGTDDPVVEVDGAPEVVEPTEPVAPAEPAPVPSDDPVAPTRGGPDLWMRRSGMIAA